VLEAVMALSIEMMMLKNGIFEDNHNNNGNNNEK